MIPASYAVIRYIPDPGRNEALNVGIIAWSEHAFRVRVDVEAIARVVRENPHLERDALAHLEAFLNEQLSRAAPKFTPPGMLEFLERHPGFPVSLTEARYTTIEEHDPDPLTATVDRLLERIVKPRRRWGGAGLRPIDMLERRFRPFIDRHAIERNQPMTGSRTGLPRQVHFFVNSGANVALDVLQLALQRADDIRLRADAEAFKIFDLKGGEGLNYGVYCAFSDKQELQETNLHAAKTLATAGAKVLGSLDEAFQFVEPYLPQQRPPRMSRTSHIGL